MKYFKSAVTTAILLASIGAQASGDKVGGGGHTVVCTTPDGKMTTDFFDVYVAKQASLDPGSVDFRPKLGDSSLTVEQKIAIAASYYAPIDPDRSKRFGTEALKMLADINTSLDNPQSPVPNGLVAMTDQPLALLNDSDETIGLPANCSKGQLAVQRDVQNDAWGDEPLSDRFYTIYSPYWKALDNDQKTALLMHEVIYKEYREAGVQTSRAARELNNEILSGQIQKSSMCQYKASILKSGLKTYMISEQIDVAKIDTKCNSPSTMTVSAAFDDNIPYQIGKSSFNFWTINLSNGEFESGQYHIDKNPKAPNCGIAADEASSGRWHWKEVKSTSEGYVINEVLLPRDTVELKKSVLCYLSHAGEITKLWNGPLASKTESYLHDSLKFARDQLSKFKDTGFAQKSVDDMTVLLQEVRTAATTQNTDALYEYMTAMGSYSPATFVKPEIAIEKPASDVIAMLISPTIISCVGKFVDIEVSALFGGEFDLGSAICDYTDGSKRKLHAHFAIVTGGVGFSIALNTVKLVPTSTPGVLSAQSDTAFQLGILHLVRGDDDGKFRFSPGLGLGAMESVDYSSVKLSKKFKTVGDDFNRAAPTLIKTLMDGLMISEPLQNELAN